MLPVLAAAAGNVFSGLLGYHGQMETNRSNETMANNATAANMAEADRNRQFQSQQATAQMAYQTAEAVKAREWEERMSNTAYQRSKEDMIKAGINPILTQTPASSPSTSAPSGAAGSGSQGSAVSAQMQNPMTHLTGVFSSALEAMKTLGDLDIQQAQAALLKAQTSKVGVDTEVVKKDLPKSELINEGYRYLKNLFNKFRNGDSTSAKSRENMQKLLRSTKP